jgi:hypothetical protein
MIRLIRPLGVLAAILAPLALAAPASAQPQRTWVSGTGSDSAACSRTQPCQTFAAAFNAVAVHGEINCIDGGGFGTLTITKSVTIDCHDVFASINASSGTGITINFDAFSDPRKTVRLRNLNINGVDSGNYGIQIIGSNGGRVLIEDCLVDGFYGSPGRGISDQRTGGGNLAVTNTTVRNVAASGIVAIPNPGNPAKLHALLQKVRVHNAGSSGIAMINNTRANITDSSIEGSTNGVEGSGSGSFIVINNSTISNNNTGILSNSSALITLNASVLSDNATVNSGSGTLTTHTTNVADFNSTIISASAAGGSTTASGLQ